MNMRTIFSFLLLFVFSCTDNKQRNNVRETAAPQDTLTPPHITIIADLPDSLQPHAETKGKGRKISLELITKKLLPLLQDDKGKVIKDSLGNAFVMGSGGMSHFTNFSTDNGLALDGVSCSMMDKAGNLWFGTLGGGVSRYDGKSFTTFSTARGLANNDVKGIAEDKAGNLWFCTYGGGMSRYDGTSFTTISTEQGLANNQVRCVIEDKAGILWFGTNGGVSRFDPSSSPKADTKSFTNFSTGQGLANKQVLSICEDKKGILWFGTYGGGVSRFDPSVAPSEGSRAFTNFSTAQGLPNNIVCSIVEDKTGNLWFATHGGGVSRYDGKSFTNFSTRQGLADNNVYSIAEDKIGNLWFATDGGGISRYDGKTFTSFSTAQGLANNSVGSITEDRTGNIWFTTYGGGVSRFNGKAFTNFSTVQGLGDNQVVTICEDKMGNLWFGQNGRASVYDGRSFTVFSNPIWIASNSILSIGKDNQGNLWFGTDGGGVSRYDGKLLTTFSTAQGLVNNSVRSIVQDRTGALWFGTDGGVSRYVPSDSLRAGSKSFTTFSTAQGLASNLVSSIMEDEVGNLWFGTNGGGVSRYDGKSFITFSTAQGLANNYVNSIAQDKAGNLWFATFEGVSVMSAAEAGKLSTYVAAAANPQGKSVQNRPLESNKDKNAHVPRIFRSFTKTEGLSDNFVIQILQMPDGRMSIGTNLGITIIKPSDDLTALNDIEIYNSNTDCPVKDVNQGQNCMLLDSKGIIWAGTGNEKTALVRFDPSALRKNNDPPLLIIKSIKVNEENICWQDIKNAKAPAHGDRTSGNGTPAYITEEVGATGKVLTERERDDMNKRFSSIDFDSISRFYPIPGHLVLPYKYNRITIDFNAIETGHPGLVNYQYMLEGYENDWSPVSKKTIATFGNIPEGSYNFKVKAQGPNGIWCQPVMYSFKVLPPWYRTWWAYCIYCTLFLLLLRIFIKWRERNLQIEKENLEKTVIKRTAEVVAEKNEVEKQRQRSDELLLNILPGEVAEELKAKGTTTARQFNNVTVLFTDFVNFTLAGERLSAQGLVDELHNCFKAFDEITGKYGVEKIKTIGDAYMAVAGLPTTDPNHAENILKAALDINTFMQDRLTKQGSKTFEIRMGVHSGSVVAGIVGVKKFAYDIWGDTVNTAARMEQNSKPGHINISEATYDLVKDKFACTYRGEIDAKGKGMMKMYYVLAANIHQ